MDMTVAAEEVRGMTMAHNDEVFNGHAYDTEDMCDLQQYNGNQNVKIFEFLWRMLSQVAFSDQHEKG